MFGSQYSNKPKKLMKTSYFKLITVVLVSFMYMTACDSPTKSGDQDEIRSIEDLVIPSSFDWKTQKEVEFNITGYQTSSVRVYSEDGTQLMRVNAFQGNEASFKVTVPAYMQTVTVVYRGQEKEFNLGSSAINHVFEPQGS